MVSVVQHDERPLAGREVLLQHGGQGAHTALEHRVGDGQLGIGAADVVGNGEPELIGAAQCEIAQVGDEVAGPAAGGFGHEHVVPIEECGAHARRAPG
ncbi:hypothetical protein [Paracidovorax wautersii]|uniref:hypothetical protein n=1 Tax=Paracidovorax wautersii TaxID=1177982 RepID=UPI001FE7A55F|nr:hypothetical protein [Paracidovorax wautersii]